MAHMSLIRMNASNFFPMKILLVTRPGFAHPFFNQVDQAYKGQLPCENSLHLVINTCSVGNVV